jgi:hypothetical protein
MAEYVELRAGPGISIGYRCLQDVERMSNSRFTLNEKMKIFPISEDCLTLNIYSPTEITAGDKRPVYSPEDPIQLDYDK